MHPIDSHRPLILVVDDAPESIEPIVDCLQRADFRTRIATSGNRALQLASSKPVPDLILLDVSMPDMDGYEVCSQLMNDPVTANIPVIFLTIRNEEMDEQLGFDAGAVDYITKPISPPIVLARVKTQLQLKAAADFLKDQNAYLEQEVASRTREITAIQDVTILAMASLAETRDSDTGNHIRRTQYYVKALAEQLRTHPRFAAVLTDEFIATLFKSAPLHDIGKVGIPDRILLKPGRFEAHEFDIMKTHTTLGCDAIQHAETALGMDVAFLSMAKDIALSHQEKWDGSGYPQGLAGEAIPVSARLMAVDDVYDALISRRVYKSGMPHEKAVGIIIEGRATHFDPDMVDAFVKIQASFQTIAGHYADSDADIERKADYLSQAIQTPDHA